MAGSSVIRQPHPNHFWSQCGVVALTLLGLLFAELPWLALCTHFDFPAFSSMDDFFALMDAHHVPENFSVNLNSVVDSANPESGSYGRLFYTKEPVQMRDSMSRSILSFSTSFTFTITQKEGANRSGPGMETSMLGFSFFTSNIARLTHKYSNSSGTNIYANGIRFPQNKYFGVEFDTFQNHLVNDPSDNHIGVDLNSLESLYTYNLCGHQITQCPFPWTGKFYTAWIEYNVASPLLLEVWMTNGSLVHGILKPTIPIITVPKLDLIDIFEENMYVGFMASSRRHIDIFNIQSWKFTSYFMDDMKLKKTHLSTRNIIMVISSLFGTVLFIYLMSRYWWQRKCFVTTKYSNLFHLVTLQKFAYKDLKKATKNFHESAILGSGAFGIVYKGILKTHSNHSIVAIKCFKRVESKSDVEAFLTEASSINQVRHRNLVQLQGWCYEGNHFMLVFDYMSNGSLDEWLFPKRRKHPNDLKYKKFEGVFPWTLRCSILGGIAAAIEYLHEDWVQCILHRDIKSSNVMLDDDMNPHLGDFGLARLIDHEKLEKTTLAAGTLSYMAPELPYTGKATKESDVYSFGILMLEVLCGKPPLNQQADGVDEDIFLLQSVWRAHEANNILSVVDHNLLTKDLYHSKNANGNSMPTRNRCYRHGSNESLEPSASFTSSMPTTEPLLEFEEGKKIMNLLHISMICCLPNPKSRPSIRVVKQVVKELENESNTSITMVDLISNLPSRRPLGPYSPLEADTQVIQDSFNSSSKHQHHSYRRKTQSLLTVARVGHELP
ncbi:hypothetical protein KC19_2G179100 [Ceratodon purpureus]|uniref:Protein kinase domain-containing protein n=1 Tax=Ceratodon purpureus TaxID=3225 RepID=A0A8T0IV77_CERPU|nr:hypothetical protein KC19_2G179100 [Ceratodon purpureus]